MLKLRNLTLSGLVWDPIGPVFGCYHDSSISAIVFVSNAIARLTGPLINYRHGPFYSLILSKISRDFFLFLYNLILILQLQLIPVRTEVCSTPPPEPSFPHYPERKNKFGP